MANRGRYLLMGQLRIPFLFVLIAALVVLTIFTPLMTARSQPPTTGCTVVLDGQSEVRYSAQ